MSLSIVCKKTDQLSPEQIEQMRCLFEKVFQREHSKDLFKRRFLKSVKGYSYHGLLIDKNEIVGSFSAIPYRYIFFDKECIFALSVDTMIDKPYRGRPERITAMAGEVYKALIEDGVPFIYGFPNEYYYSHEKRIVGTRDIGKLHYYVLPVNIGTVIGRFKFLNALSGLFARCWLGFSLTRKKHKDNYGIVKVNDEVFKKHRYGECYDIVRLGSTGECVCRLYVEEKNVRVLYLIDVAPLEPAVFKQVLLKLLRTMGQHLDIFIYVGKLPFTPSGLIRVPGRLEPQKIRMTGKILIPEVVDERVFDIENWAVNISNFDVR